MNNNSYNFDNAKKENNPLEFKRQAISYDVNPNWYTSNKRQFVKLKIKGEL